MVDISGNVTINYPVVDIQDLNGNSLLINKVATVSKILDIQNSAGISLVNINGVATVDPSIITSIVDWQGNNLIDNGQVIIPSKVKDVQTTG